MKERGAMETERLAPISGSAEAQPREALTILVDAAKLSVKCRRPLILYMFIYLVFYFLQLFSFAFGILPAITSMVKTLYVMGMSEPSLASIKALLPGLLSDLRTLDKWYFALILLTYLFISFLQTAAITALTVAKEEERFDLKSHLLMTVKKWRPAMVTILYKDIILNSLFLLWVGFISGIVFIFDFSVWSIILGVIILIFGLLLVLYLGMVLDVGIVITVAEEGGFGLTALGRASEIIQGRKGKALLLNFLRIIVIIMVSAVVIFLPIDKYPLLFGVFGCLIIGPVAFWSTAVDVEFYSECSLQGEGRNKSFLYSYLPTYVPASDGTQQKVGS